MSVGCEGGEIEYKLTVDTSKVLRDTQQLNILFSRTLNLMRRFGLPEGITQAIAVIQRLIATIYALRLALIALQAAAGPVGWALALVGLGATAVTYVDTIEMGMRTR